MNSINTTSIPQKHSAFTLVELIISIMISGIILVFLFTIVSNIVRDIQSSITKSQILTEIGNFTTNLNNYKNYYTEISVLELLPASGGGPNLLMMTNIEDNKGILFGVVDGDSLQPEKMFSQDFTTKKLIGYRELSPFEVGELQADQHYAYNLVFQKENLLQKVVIKDLDVSLYNSGSIINMSIEVHSGYRDGFDTVRYSEIGDEYIEKYNFNF